MKATNVGGIYDKDPMKNDDAKMYRALDYRKVATERLNVMDATAITLCEEKALPDVVFNVNEDDNICRAIRGECIGSIVNKEGVDDRLEATHAA